MRNVTRRSERASIETSVSFGVGVRCGVPWAFDSENAANINKSDPNANLLNPVVISVSLSVLALINISHGQGGEPSSLPALAVIYTFIRLNSEAPQNSKRAPSCKLRGGRTEVTAPKPVLLTRFPFASNGEPAVNVVLTVSNWVWLNALKASRRISNFALSFTWKRFEGERSQLLIGER